MNHSTIDTQPLGDRAFLLSWKEPVEASDVAGTARAIAAMGLTWLQEAVASYRTIAFHLKSGAYDTNKAADETIRLLQGIDEPRRLPSRYVELPVVYGGEAGPDLEECARRSGLTAEAFVERHSDSDYEVAMLGFAPGFPYLSGLHESLDQPRHDTPRMQVPSGSVGIARNQTGVYSVASPGGWQIIGRTSVPLFRPEAERPFLLAQGDIVKFVPVTKESQQSSEETAWERSSGPVEVASPRSPVLRVLKPGLLTTIQDLGRAGWQAYGVSVGGAMDEASMRKANLLVGNDEGAAVLELTMIGGGYSVEGDTLIAIVGGDLQASVDGKRLPLNRPIFMRGGSRIDFGAAVSGCRAYVAIAGGIDVPLVLGSRSADPRAGIGGGFGRALRAGDSIGALPPSARSGEWLRALRSKADAGGESWSASDWSVAGWEQDLPYEGSRPGKPRILAIRTLIGAEWEQFASESKEALFKEAYRVEASSDRMGLRLSGTRLRREMDGELQSRGVVPGTIQVPPGGQPIALAAACQPTGGYPVIAHVIRADLPLLAQSAPGDLLAFEPTDIRTAERALRQRERDIGIMNAGVRALTPESARGGA